MSACWSHGAALLLLLQVADMRISYEVGGLEEADFAGRDPMALFDEWFKAAVAGKVREHRAAAGRREGGREGGREERECP